jgi:hypothetical protein
MSAAWHFAQRLVGEFSRTRTAAPPQSLCHPDDVSAQARPVISARPFIGVLAVLLGAVISTLDSRITTFGLADVRGAVHAGFDEGAWITTAFTVGQTGTVLRVPGLQLGTLEHTQKWNVSWTVTLTASGNMRQNAAVWRSEHRKRTKRY